MLSLLAIMPLRQHEILIVLPRNSDSKRNDKVSKPVALICNFTLYHKHTRTGNGHVGDDTLVLYHVNAD